MAAIRMLSSALPEINDPIKECVNFGRWFLFKADIDAVGDDDVAFYLIATDAAYVLGRSGRVLGVVDRKSTTPHLREAILFSDVSSPETISNLR